MTGGKSERSCRSEKWLTSPAKWHKCPAKSNTVLCWLPEECEWRLGTRSSRGQKSVWKAGHCMCVSAGRTPHTSTDMVTSLWFMCTPGLPPGPDRDGRLFKKPFPPRAARETSGRSEQSASSFIKHLRERSLLDTRITFEIPPVTSQPPKHGSWSFKYLYVRKGGRRTSICRSNWDETRCILGKKRREHCIAFGGLQQDTQKGSSRISGAWL